MLCRISILSYRVPPSRTAHAPSILVATPIHPRRAITRSCDLARVSAMGICTGSPSSCLADGVDIRRVKAQREMNAYLDLSLWQAAAKAMSGLVDGVVIRPI